MQKIKVSIIIVFYNNKNELFRCLRSIKESKVRSSHEVIVVNNSSRELELRGVRYVKAPKNLGYGAGNNLGVKYAKGKYLMILNADTKILPTSIDQLVEFLDKHENTAIVAPNLLDKDGRVFKQMGSRELSPIRGVFALSFVNKLFPGNPISAKYWALDLPTDKLRELDAVPGSAFMIRKKVFEEVGKYDENMFLFFEESDLGKRVRKLGYKIFIYPRAETVHYWRKDNKLKKYFEKSRFYYFRKHFGLASALLVEAFAKFGVIQAFVLFVILVIVLILL